MLFDVVYEHVAEPLAEVGVKLRVVDDLLVEHIYDEGEVEQAVLLAFQAEGFGDGFDIAQVAQVIFFGAPGFEQALRRGRKRQIVISGAVKAV